MRWYSSKVAAFGVIFMAVVSCDEQRIGTDASVGDGRVNTETGPSDGSRSDGSSPNSFCHPDPFCWEAPLPQGNWLGGVWGSSDSNVYTVGQTGTVLRFDGKSWGFEPVPTTATLMAVWGAGANDLYAVSNCQTLLHFDGKKWEVQIQAEFGQAYIRGIWGSGPKDIFVIGSGGTVVHYDGSSWKATQVGATSGINSGFSAVWGSSSTDVWAVTYSAIWHFDGKIWSKADTGTLKPEGLTGIWGSKPTDVFFNGHKMWHYNGAKWTEKALDKAEGGAVWGSGPQEVYAIRNGNGTSSSPGHKVWRYDGTTWSPLQDPPTSKRLSGLWGAAPGRVYVVGEGGTLLRHDKGKGWTSLVKLQGDSVTCLWGSSSTNVFAGRGSDVLHRDAAGWSPTSFPGNKEVESLWGSGPQSVYASSGGAIWHYKGGTWTKMTATIPGPKGSDRVFAKGLWGRSDSEIYAAVKSAGSKTTPAIVRYDSAKWTELKELSCDVTALWGVGAKDLFAATTCSLLRYDGQKWHESHLAVPATGRIDSLWGDSPKQVYAAGSENMGQQGLVLRYNGDAWAKMKIPKVSQLHAVWGQSDNEIYAAGWTASGSRATVLYYDGATWSEMHTAVGSGLKALWGDGASHVFAGGMHGAILHRGL
jgi:hypothetical protein